MLEQARHLQPLGSLFISYCIHIYFILIQLYFLHLSTIMNSEKTQMYFM